MGEILGWVLIAIGVVCVIASVLLSWASRLIFKSEAQIMRDRIARRTRTRAMYWPDDAHR